MNTFRDKEAIMNKDFVLDFVAGGMTYPVHTFIIPCVFQKSGFQNLFWLRCVCCSEQDRGGSTGEGQVAAPDSGEWLLSDDQLLIYG